MKQREELKYVKHTMNVSFYYCLHKNNVRLTIVCSTLETGTPEVDENSGVRTEHDGERQPRQANHVNHPPHVKFFAVLPARNFSQVLPGVYLQQPASQTFHSPLEETPSQICKYHSFLGVFAKQVHRTKDLPYRFCRLQKARQVW